MTDRLWFWFIVANVKPFLPNFSAFILPVPKCADMARDKMSCRQVKQKLRFLIWILSVSMRSKLLFQTVIIAVCMTGLIFTNWLTIMMRFGRIISAG